MCQAGNLNFLWLLSSRLATKTDNFGYIETPTGAYASVGKVEAIILIDNIYISLIAEAFQPRLFNYEATKRSLVTSRKSFDYRDL